MFYRSFALHASWRILRRRLFVLLCLSIALLGIDRSCLAQSYQRELSGREQIIIRNPDGRVFVTTASDEQQKTVSIKAESPGTPVADTDVRTTVTDGAIEIEARGRGERNRIDLTVRLPQRAKVRVSTDAGAVDLVGNFREAAVETNTGTVRADVPIESLSFSFRWTASRPRYFSEVELPKVKERAGGRFEIAGRLGDKEAKKEERVRLDIETVRGVVLFGVDPEMVPSDLRERVLTEAARAIIRSGNEELVEAIHKVSPRFVGEYTERLPRLRASEPTLIARQASSRNFENVANSNAASLARLNASVTDHNGRAISRLTTKDFVVIENGEDRTVTDVAPSEAPFNLVLLLDVSGSVEERLDFIRKAALSFANTASPQDRIAIISFRDDVQLISDFTTDRRLLAERIKQIEAGGATALYDALAYTLIHTLRPLRNERTAIVVLSDGDDNRSFLPFPAVTGALRESGALIYPLYIPSGLIPSSSAPKAESTLDPIRTRFLTLASRAEDEGRKLADISGGVYYPITRLDDLQRAYDDVVAQLRTSYTITYASNRGASKERERRIRVRVRSEGATVRVSPAVSVASP